MITKQQEYVNLLAKFSPKTIQTEEELDKMQKVINGLIDKPQLTEAEEDLLDLLGTLVYYYEQQHWIIL